MQWFKRAVSILPGSPFFHLRFLLALSSDEQLAALEWLSCNLGQVQQLGLVHPQQFQRFNTMLDLLAADRGLRLHLIGQVRQPQDDTGLVQRLDALMALLVYLSHPVVALQPRAHRHYLQQCKTRRYDSNRLLHWYARFEIDTQAYATACQQLGLDLLADETRLRKALRKARSEAHPDHQGNTRDFLQLEQLKQALAL